MRIGAVTQEVRQGDAIAIEPGQVHRITSIGE